MPSQSKRLTVSVRNGQLVIAIGVRTLAHAVTHADWANKWQAGESGEPGDYVRTFAITDAGTFAEEVAHMMQEEAEDGSSPLSDFLDKMCEAAVDDGSEVVEYDQRIPFGKTAPVETWAGAETPKGSPT